MKRPLCYLLLALTLLAPAARASTQTVPPNGAGGQQAKAESVKLGLGYYNSILGGYSLVGQYPFLYLQPQITQFVPGEEFLLGIVSFGFFNGESYASFGNYDVRVVSSGGSGAYFEVSTSDNWLFPSLTGLYEFAWGSRYTDDATIVIDPPHMNDFQGALDNTNVDVIQLQTGTYFQDAVINRNLTIRGEGIGKTIVDGAQLGSVFRILPGKTVVLEDMTIVNGLAPSGGGVFNDGNLTVNRCEVAYNRAHQYFGGEGGGIFNRGGAKLTIRDSYVHDNIAERDGGGISSSGFNFSTLGYTGGGSASNVLAGTTSDLTNSVPTDLSSLNSTNAQQQFADDYNTSVATRLPPTNALSTKDFLLQAFADPFTNLTHWLAIGSPVCVISNTVIANNQVGTAGAVAAIQTLYGNTRLPRFACFGAGVHSDLGLLTIQDSTLTGNHLDSDLGNFGGAVSSMFGALKVTNSKLNNNRISTTTVLGMGGAIHSFGSYTRVSDSQMISNTVGALFLSSGGALKNTFASYTEIDRCQMTDNISGGGGAIANDYYGILQLNDSSLLRNSVSGIIGANGGGLRNDEAGQAVLTRCTISANSASGRAKGGGLYNECTMTRIADIPVVFISTLTLRNCTISSNLVDGQGIFGIPLSAQGGGIFNGSSQLAAANTFVSSCTIYGNRAIHGLSQSGGGVFSTARSGLTLGPALTNNGLALVQFANTLLANNEPQDCYNRTLTLTTFLVSLGYNMDSDAFGGLECALTDSVLSPAAQFHTAANPRLGPLQNNGGRTPTHALLPGSPAIDAGSPDGVLSSDLSPADDQRGLARSLGGRRDIGSFENSPPIAAGEGYHTLEDLPLVVDAFSGVLSNDFANGLMASLVTAPAKGTLSLALDGSFTYLPATGFVGTDTFVYRVVDAYTNTSPNVTATIVVQPRLHWVAMTPKAGIQAERYANISLTFDEAVSSNAVAANVTLLGSLSGPHGFTVSVAGTNATLNPTTDFSIAEQVSVLVSSNLLSIAGSPHFPTETQSFSIFPNRPPVGVGETYTVAEDTLLQVTSPTLLANDSDPEGDPVYLLTNIVVTGSWYSLAANYPQFININNQPFYIGQWPNGTYGLTIPSFAQHGTLNLSTNGAFTYQPNTNFTGTDTFQYRVTDTINPPVSVSVTINVTPVNDPPVSVPDYYPLGTVSVGAANGVLANDTDVDSSPGTFRALLASQASHGSIVLNTNGGFTYTPTNGYTGADAFTYRVSDGFATSGVARVKIGNTVPIATTDLYPPAAGAPVVITNIAQGLLANDSDPDGDSPLTALLEAPPANGTATLNADGTFTYTPNAGFTNTDSFTYRVNDGIESSAPARVKLGDTPPVAANDTGYDVFAGLTLNVPADQGVLTNDTDADADPLTAQLVSPTTHGTLALSPNGSFTYTPTIGYAGNDTFTYRASDGFTNSTTATVTIGVYDYLHVTQRSPVPNSAVATSNGPIKLTFNAAISATTVSNHVAIHGSFSGRHTYTFTVNSNLLTIQPTGSFRPGELVSVSLLGGIRGTGFFQLQQSLNWSFTTRAPRGSGFFTQTSPNTNVVPAYSVALGDLNGDGRIDAFVLVQGGPPQLYFNLGNHAFTNRSETLGLNWSFNNASMVAVGDFNGDGALDIVATPGASAPAVGLNNGTGTFTPVPLPAPPDSVKFLVAGDFNGDGNLDLLGCGFTYAWVWFNDGTGHFTLGPAVNIFHGNGNFANGIAVGDVNGDGALDVYLACFSGDKLLLNDGTGAFMLSDTPLDNHLNYDASLVDVDGDGDLDLVLGPSNYRGGTVWFNDGAGHFARSPYEFTGQLSYSLACADLNGDGTFDTFYRGPGATVAFNDGSGHFTSSGQSLGYSNVLGVAVADLDGDGDLDVFSVGGSRSTPTGPEIWYNQTAPTARNDLYAANGSNPIFVSAVTGVLSNDVAGDGGVLRALLASNPTHGTVAFNTNGSFTYTPGGSFAGTDAFTYRASDGVSTSSVARVKIGNTTPVAVADTNYVAVNDATLRVDAPGVLGNDTDAEGDPLTALLVSAPAHGTVLLVADGSFAYTAVSNYIGGDTFTYKATDGFSTSAVVSVTLQVHARLAVVATSPAVNALRMGAGDSIVLGFNRALNSASIATNIFVAGSFTGPHGFSASRQSAAAYSGPGAALFRAAGAVDVLTLAPTNSFLPGEQVSVTLAAALEGGAGERQDAPAQYAFTVEAPFGLGQFTDSGQRLGSNATFSVVMADFDHDGALDVTCGNLPIFQNGTNIPGSAALILYHNNGAGQLTDSGQRLGDFSTGTLGAADVTGDGTLDLLADEHVWTNNNTGQFGAGQIFPTVEGGSIFADVNLDGRPDIITWNTTNITVWINQGGGVYSNNPASVSALNFANLHLYKLAVGDLNGDGSPDIMVMQFFTADPCKVWLNDGHGNFHESGQVFGHGGSALALGDVDGDGFLDAVFLSGSSSGSGSYVWLNRGDGTFSDSGQIYPGTNNISAAKLADMNGDGALDLVVLQDDYSTYVNTSTILFNNGSGVFSPSGIVIGDSTRDPNNSARGYVINRSLAIGDLNGDGAPDIYISVDQFGVRWASQVWLNRGALGPIDGSASIIVNDNQTTTPFTNVVVRGPANTTITLTLDSIAKGTFTPASLAAGGFSGPVGNTFTRASATPASAQTALRQLVFVPTINHLPVGSNETASFTIFGNDGLVSRTNNAFTVTSVSINDAPVAVNDSGPGFSGSAKASFVTASVLANDSDPDPGDTFTMVNVNTSFTSGSVSNLGNGTFRYTPNPALASLPAGATGNDSFTYTIRDQHGASALATVTLTLFGSNDPPVAVNDLINVFKNGGQVALTAALLANDYDPDAGDTISISAVSTGGTKGKVSFDPVAGVAYNPTGAFTNLPDGVIALDTFNYTIRDSIGATASAIVTIRVFGADSPPIAQPDALSLTEHSGRTNLNALLLANDYDPDSGQTPLISITGVDPTGTIGSVTFSNGIVAYDPAGRFESLAVGQSTNDTFHYTIATPTVATIAHTPVAAGLLQSETFLPVRVDLSVQGNLSLSFNGEQIYTNLPLPGFTPLTAARFGFGGRTGGKFETHDIDDLSLSLVTATPTNLTCDFSSNAPAGSILVGSATITNGFLRLTPASMNQTGSIILPDLAPSNAVSGFTAIFKVRMGSGSTPPADGFSFVWANNLTNAAFGEDGAGYGLIVSFDTFDNADGEAPALDVKWRTPAAQGLVTVTIKGLNDPPTAMSDFIALDEGSASTDLTATLIANDSDPDNGETATLAISAVSGVTTNGVLSLQGGTLRYAPYANANLGAEDVVLDSFTYTLRDVNGATTNALVTLYILGTNNVLGAAPSLRIARDTGATERIEFSAQPGALFDLQTSTNLVNWTFYASVVARSNGLVSFIERNSTNSLMRFYRARTGNFTAMPPGLVSYWRADGDTLDSFGLNNAQPTNGLGFTTGHVGGAFNFTGGSERLLINAPPIPLPWTASFWVNRQDAFDPSDALLSDSTYALKLEQYQASRRVGITQYGVNDPAYNYTVPTNTWTHLAFVATTNGTALYVNGSYLQTIAFSFPLPMQMISRPGTTDRLRAALDETAVFNRALTPPEILNLFQATQMH